MGPTSLQSAEEVRFTGTERHERGQRNIGVVNFNRIAQALDMRLSELFAEVEKMGELER